MDRSSIIQNVKNNGFHHYPNFISKNEAKNILNQIISLNGEKGKGNGTTFYNGKRKLVEHLKNLKFEIWCIWREAVIKESRC